MSRVLLLRSWCKWRVGPFSLYSSALFLSAIALFFLFLFDKGKDNNKGGKGNEGPRRQLTKLNSMTLIPFLIVPLTNQTEMTFLLKFV